MAKNIEENVFYQARKELGWTRDEASEHMRGMPAYRIEKIETGKLLPKHEDVVIMAEGYRKPELKNYYCRHYCDIGGESVPEIESKELSQIALQVLASLTSLTREKDRLVEISVDGEISQEELRDFAHIKKELATLSTTVDELQLWIERMELSGRIDTKEFDKIMEEL